MLNPKEICSFDERRDWVVPGSLEETLSFATEHWIHSAQRAIQQKGRFAVALSGGSTPKAIYQRLALRKKDLDWSKVWLFWSDERSVASTHPESNYRMAMDSGLGQLPIPASQILRMRAETDIEQNAADYEHWIRHHLGKNLFDLVMLGLGEDGHTASLFPETKALDLTTPLVCANYVHAQKTWRMTLTFPCIQSSSRPVLYALGSSKASVVSKALKAPLKSAYPASQIGTPNHKALWILDQEAARFLL